MTNSTAEEGAIGAEAPLTEWSALLDRPRPTGAIHIAYGKDALQVGDLWLPAGAGPKPVVLMIHGGCWQTDVADRTIMDWAAADLAKRGIAVWNIEYRGADRPGGGYPGTFQDVAAAADMLREIGPRYDLRVDRIVAFGHSAGGHLALWVAARRRLPVGSVLAGGDPIRIDTVIAAGALPDLEAARVLPGNSCGATGVPMLVGAPTAARADVLADTSVSRLLPLGVKQVLVNAERDAIAPPSLGRAYVEQARAAGETVRYVEVPGSGHVELVAPGTVAWGVEVGLIRSALGLE